MHMRTMFRRLMELQEAEFHFFFSYCIDGLNKIKLLTGPNNNHRVQYLCSSWSIIKLVATLKLASREDVRNVQHITSRWQHFPNIPTLLYFCFPEPLQEEELHADIGRFCWETETPSTSSPLLFSPLASPNTFASAGWILLWDLSISIIKVSKVRWEKEECAHL